MPGQQECWDIYCFVGMLFTVLLLGSVVNPRARAGCHTVSPHTCQVPEHKFYRVSSGDTLKVSLFKPLHLTD